MKLILNSIASLKISNGKYQPSISELNDYLDGMNEDINGDDFGASFLVDLITNRLESLELDGW